MLKWLLLLVCAGLFAWGSSGFAQSLTEVNPAADIEASHTGVSAVLLWDNRNINLTTSGIVSNDLRGRHPDSSLVNTADDFVIPAGTQWSIDSIYARGFSTVSGTVDSFAIAIYADSAGRPSPRVFYRAVIPANGIRFDSLQLRLSPPAILGPGTYWLSIYGVYNTGTVLTSTRWNWYQGPTPVGLTAHIQDFTGLFGIPPFPWTPVTSLGVPNPSCYFALFGTSGGAQNILVILQDSTVGSIAKKKPDRDTLFTYLPSLVSSYTTIAIDSTTAVVNLTAYSTVIYLETSFDSFIPTRYLGSQWRNAIKNWLNGGTPSDRRSLVMMGADVGYNYDRTASPGIDTMFSRQFLKFAWRLDNANVTGQNSITGQILDPGLIFSLNTVPPGTGFFPDGCRPLPGSSVLYYYTGRSPSDSVAGIGWNGTGYSSAVLFQDPRYFNGLSGNFGQILRSLLQFAGVTTSVNPTEGETPVEFSLMQNYPNPFNPTTRIRYALPEAAHVTLMVYNILGQAVATLVNASQAAGRFEVTWDGRNDAGAVVSSGVYFYQMQATGRTSITPSSSFRKMIFLK